MYHLNKKGLISKCFAFLKECPYGQHFESKEEGASYVNIWDNNRISFPDLAEEEICLPENNGIAYPSSFSKNFEITLNDKKKINVNQINKKSLIVLDNMETPKNIANFLDSQIDEIDMPSNNSSSKTSFEKEYEHFKLNRKILGNASDVLNDKKTENTLYIFYNIGASWPGERTNDSLPVIAAKSTFKKIFRTLYQRDGLENALKAFKLSPNYGKIGNSKILLLSPIEKEKYPKKELTLE